MRVESIELRIYVEGVLLPSRALGGVEFTVTRGGRLSGSFMIPAIPGLRPEDWARARVLVSWSDAEIRSAGDDWPVLFTAEISGHGFSKTPSGRNVQFGLVGEEVYYDQCKLYFYSLDRSPVDQGGNNLDIEVTKKALFFGNSQVETESNATGLSLQNRIVAKMREAGQGKPLPSLVRRVFKDVVSSVNHFFSQANEQLKLDQRFALPRDDNVSLLYATQELFFQQVDGNTASAEGATPIRAVLDQTLALMRYCLQLNAQPRLVSGGEQYRLRSEAERTRLRAVVEQKVVDRLGVTIDDLSIDGKTTNGVLEDIAQSRTTDILTAANLAPETLTNEELDAITAVTATDADIQEINRQRIGETFAFLVAIRDELARLSAPATEVDQNPLFPAGEDEPKDQLAQFIMIPETDFSLPPTCNVIFPSDSASYGMSRDHLVEPTRMMASVPIVADNISKLFFAPESMVDARITEQEVKHVSVDGLFPPVLTGHKTSRFGLRKAPIARSDGAAYEGHSGLDIGVPEGTPVYALDDGKVVHAGPQNPKDLKVGGGIFVAIQHTGRVMTQYLHLSRVVVTNGNSVKAGDLIAYSGTTGRSTGPHLHFDYIVGGTHQDPEPIFDAAVANYKKGAQDTTTPEAAIIPEVTLQEDAAKQTSRFDDFKYLTPEEDIVGIVPIIDASMDKVSTSFERDNAESFENYMRQHVLSEFQHDKYMSRPIPPVPMTWSPQIVAGFPALIVDPVRSIIAQVEAVTHRWSVGGTEATTTVTLSQPRYWNEGDPFYWRRGEAKFKTGEQIPNIPDAEVAAFPSFFLPSLVATNSYESDPTAPNNVEAFGGSKTNRDCDELYKSLLGVPAIPYFYAETQSPVTGSRIAYNSAIDGVDPNTKARGQRTLVGYYENLIEQDRALAQQFASSYTRRLGATESEILGSFLGATPGDGGYTGGPFRDRVRNVIKDFIVELNSSRNFRG